MKGAGRRISLEKHGLIQRALCIKGQHPFEPHLMVIVHLWIMQLDWGLTECDKKESEKWSFYLLHTIFSIKNLKESVRTVSHKGS